MKVERLLEIIGSDFYTGVPDSQLKALCNYLIKEYGKDVYKALDKKIWEGAAIDGCIYAIPNQKEIASMPMWVFSKEYVEKYNIPYKDIKTLEDLAEKLARTVERTKKSVTLEPMTAYERKIIHTKLQNNSKVKTFSKGEEPYRKVVISLK